MVFKQTEQTVEDLDEKQGIVVAYASVYGNEDSYGDVMQPNAYKRTVKNNFSRLRVYENHDSRRMVGVPKELDADDSYGLLTKTQFNLKKEMARDLFTDIIMMQENKQNAELSVGGYIVKWEKNPDNESQTFINEFKLMEYSFLTNWAANPLALVEDIKDSSMTKEVLIQRLVKMYDLNYSDTRLKQIEDFLQSLSKPTDSVETKDVISSINKAFKNHGY